MARVNAESAADAAASPGGLFGVVLVALSATQSALDTEVMWAAHLQASGPIALQCNGRKFTRPAVQTGNFVCRKQQQEATPDGATPISKGRASPAQH